jgi:predicted PhzF superfamily epimerase YddE/YHI9
MNPSFIPYFHVDAFASQAFRGNPAGVCPLEEWLPDEILQAMAYEHHLAETAFFVSKAPGHYHLRWFTPETEVDLCGHATLATAHVLWNHLDFRDDQIDFETQSGPLRVTREKDLLALDFPSRPPRAATKPSWLGEAALFLQARDAMIVLDTAEAVSAFRPDFKLLSQLDGLGVIVTAPGHEVDFVSRFFAPKAGVPEDPVTGSAHCTLIPYWAARLGKNRLHARQLSRRGGELFCALYGERVSIAGYAVTYFQGRITYPITSRSKLPVVIAS